jgi:hypothetical protein
MRGKPLGFGIETQALEAAAGLNSASGRMRRCVGEAMLVGRAMNLLVCWIHADEGGNSEFCGGGADFFFGRGPGPDKIGRDRVHGPMHVFRKRDDPTTSMHLFL